MKIEDVKVYGFQPALHAMRNPMDSWSMSDSQASSEVWWGPNKDILAIEGFTIGNADMELACRLIKRGSEHRKFLRQIIVWMNITLPRYVWQELDYREMSYAV